MDIIFKGRQTEVPARFREHATAKLNKIEKLDQKAMRVDVEVSVERNPRLASQKERVELTIRSRGPAIRAEAAAEDRFAALDLALAKLDSRLRRSLERRKNHHGPRNGDRLAIRREADTGPGGRTWPEPGGAPDGHGGLTEPSGERERAMPADLLVPPGRVPPGRRAAARNGGVSADGVSPDSLSPAASDSVVTIDMEGDGPLVVRQKFHRAEPISIDQALFEMELVGHDFYLFHDIDQDLPSVVYRRRGYQYGVIRLVGGASAAGSGPEPGSEFVVPAVT